MTAIDKSLVSDQEYTKAVKKIRRTESKAMKLFNITLSTTTSLQA